MKHFVVYRLFFLLILAGVLSCSKTAEVEIIEEIATCTTSEFSITSQDNIVFPHATDPTVWKGKYNIEKVKIDFTISVGTDGETEQFNFVFAKSDNCLKLDYAFKYYDGKEVDISAITTIPVDEFYIIDWKEDQLFSGVVVYRDPHNKISYTRKFWVEFSKSDKLVEETNFTYFNDCLGGKLPIDIDVNNDSFIDFKLVYEKDEDIGNAPKFSSYTVKLISTNQNKNKILSPIRNQPPYLIVYEPPFTSENKKQYFNGVKDELDVFYEFEAPFESYNFFLNNLLTYKGRLGNEKDDYFIICMELDDKTYFGWIRFSFKVLECEIEVLETFLSATENTHVSVN